MVLGEALRKMKWHFVNKLKTIYVGSTVQIIRNGIERLQSSKFQQQLESITSFITKAVAINSKTIENFSEIFNRHIFKQSVLIKKRSRLRQSRLCEQKTQSYFSETLPKITEAKTEIENIITMAA